MEKIIEPENIDNSTLLPKDPPLKPHGDVSIEEIKEETEKE